jgi:drug/metabolite transporter (DMT)-like permease
MLLALLGRNARELVTAPLPRGTHLTQAMLNCVLPWILIAWASRTIDSALTTILSSLSPIFVFLVTWAITRHEETSRRKLAGVILGIAGVLTIIGVDALTTLGTHTLAELAAVGGSLAYAIAAIVGRRFAGISPLVPAAGSNLVAAAILVPLALVSDEPWTLQPSMRSMLAVLGLAIFSTGLAFTIYFYLLARIGSISTASQAYLRILVGVGFGVAFLGERLAANTVIGLVLVFAGVVAMTLPARR